LTAEPFDEIEQCDPAFTEPIEWDVSDRVTIAPSSVAADDGALTFLGRIIRDHVSIGVIYVEEAKWLRTFFKEVSSRMPGIKKPC